MKLVSFGPYEQEKAGVAVGDEIIDLGSADASLPTTVQGILAQNALEAVAAAVLSGRGRRLAASSVRHGAPVARPSKIVCVGLNYRDHAEEQGVPLPDSPLLFSKASSAVIGPNDDVALPSDSQEVDYEVELAVIIGSRAKAVGLSDAYRYIAGYAVANDVSARDVQFRQKQWHQGKSYDTFFPFGPYLVTKDDVPDPNALHVQFDLNGRTLQNSNTDNLIFDVPTLVSRISHIMTLYPGDVISTGTPAGVGVFRNPKVLLKPGDDMVTRIDGLGVLHNRVI